MPQANSTFSRPRATSPRASPNTLPCSDVRWVAISFRLASTSSRKWNSTSERRDSDVARHAGNAPAARAARRPPCRERPGGGGHGGVDLLDRGELHLGLLLAGGRVPDRAGA